MIEIKIIDESRKSDILLKNTPFPLYGRLIPAYFNENWSYSVDYFPPEQCSEMCFPDEDYDYDSMKSDTVFVGAYDEGKCIGLALLQKGFFRYMYVNDIKVDKDYRRRGIGKMLIAECCKIAESSGSRGLYLIVQDNNLAACLFYFSLGFRLGGLDTDVYKGTKQEGKRDLILYLDRTRPNEEKE